MSESLTAVKKRPVFTNINAFSDLPNYRLPAPGWVSILHRISGVMMFALLPFIIWMFDTSISSEISFAKFKGVFNAGVFGLPGFMFKLMVLALIWAFLHHFCAGVRHLMSDMNHKAVQLPAGRRSAKATLIISIGLTVILGAKLFSLY